MGEEFKAINTQEEFDAAIKDRLKRERDKYADYDDLKKTVAGYGDIEAGYKKTIADHAKSIEDYKKQVGDLSAKAKKYETDSAKTRIALETGLPFAMATRLSGETEDDIRSDAKSLAELIGKQNQAPAPLRSTEQGSGEDAYKQLLSQLDTK